MGRMSSSMGFRGGIFGSRFKVLSAGDLRRKSKQKPYSFVLETLHNSKGSWIMDILHYQPIDRLLILSIDSGSFHELCLDPVDGVWVVVGVEVNSECIDHSDCSGKPAS
jgi:hypothetical protein